MVYLPVSQLLVMRFIALKRSNKHVKKNLILALEVVFEGNDVFGSGVNIDNTLLNSYIGSIIHCFKTLKNMKNAILPFCFLLVFVCYSCKNNTKSDIQNLSKVTVLYRGDERIFFQEYHGMEASFMMFLPLAKEAGDVEGGGQANRNACKELGTL